MHHIALWEPEIPPNTGNIARLCAATGAGLHLIGRLGFHLDDRSMKRAGLDYWQAVRVFRHSCWDEFVEWMDVNGESESLKRVVCFSAHASQIHTHFKFQDGDCLLFGSESRGLPEELLNNGSYPSVTIPMPGKQVRSLNLATAAGIGLYEALRQLHEW